MEFYYLPKCKVNIPDNIDSSDEAFYEAERLKSLGDTLCDIHHIDYKYGTAYLACNDPDRDHDYTRFMAKLEWVYFQDDEE